MSCCSYEGQLLGCSSQEFLNWLAASPEAYLQAVQQQAAQMPECIGLLDLEAAFPQVSLDRLIEAAPLETLQVTDSQTGRAAGLYPFKT